MRKVHYDYWADYIYSIVKSHVGKNPKILEFASGNCMLARFISAYYPDIIAADLSKSMLQKSYNKKLRRVCCEMTLAPFKTKFDLILCAFDSVNYLLTKKQLLTFFNETSRLISDNGIFTFDVSLEKNSFRHVKEPLRNGSYKGIRYRQHSEYDIKNKIHSNIFLIHYSSGDVKREVHKQKIYSFETYFELLNLAGLSVKECYDAFTFKNGNSNSSRVQFVVVKR